MEVTILSQDNDELALYGIGKSYGLTSGMSFTDYVACKPLKDRLKEVACKLAPKNVGEDKFLRTMSVTIEVKAPFYFLKQLDTYKVGTTCQSESTMHTILSKPFALNQFEIKNGIVETYMKPMIKVLNNLRDEYRLGDKDVWYAIIALLPEAYLQTRIYTLNYAVLKEIFISRKNHKLDEWSYFIDKIKNNIFFKEYLP